MADGRDGGFSADLGLRATRYNLADWQIRIGVSDLGGPYARSAGCSLLGKFKRSLAGFGSGGGAAPRHRAGSRPETS